MPYLAHLLGGAADGKTKEIATLYPEIRTVGTFEGRKAINKRWVYPIEIYYRDHDHITETRGTVHIPYRYSHTIEPGD